MLKSLQTFFSDFAAADETEKQHDIELAAGALLVELCKADATVSEHELEEIRATLKRFFSFRGTGTFFNRT